MSSVEKRRTYKNLTKTISKYIEQIVKELGINKKATTIFSRHSFATVMKRAGANIEMISELMGHSDTKVTKRYLDSFENEQIQEQTDVLTSGFQRTS